jgi:branched-chain amino acid transport system ATP-binding protein
MAAQHGVAVVPQGRCIVANLSVEENLRSGAVGRKGHWSVKEVYKLFPDLRRARTYPWNSAIWRAGINARCWLAL